MLRRFVTAAFAGGVALALCLTLLAAWLIVAEPVALASALQQRDATPLISALARRWWF